MLLLFVDDLFVDLLMQHMLQCVNLIGKKLEDIERTEWHAHTFVTTIHALKTC